MSYLTPYLKWDKNLQLINDWVNFLIFKLYLYFIVINNVSYIDLETVAHDIKCFSLKSWTYAPSVF